MIDRIAYCDTIVSKLTKMHTFGSKLFLNVLFVHRTKIPFGNFWFGSVEANTSVSYNTDATCVHAACVGNLVVGSVEAITSVSYNTDATCVGNVVVGSVEAKLQF